MPSLYRELFADPIYQSTVVNTALYLASGVNVKMFLALLLSGFFMRPGWWMKALLLIFVLPWAVPQISTFISIHWMLNGEWGFLNNVLYKLFHVEGPSWLNDRWIGPGSGHRLPHLEMDAVLDADPARRPDGDPARDPRHRPGGRRDGAARVRPHHLPAARQPLPDLHAALDHLPARRFQRRHFVSGGGPANQTHVLATLGIRDAFEIANPRLGVAAVMSALPMVIPLVIILMRKLRTAEVQL